MFGIIVFLLDPTKTFLSQALVMQLQSFGTSEVDVLPKHLPDTNLTSMLCST